VTASRDQAAVAVAFFFILALLVMPVPPLALDLMLSLSITVALLTMLLSLYAERPLDFSVFPAFLLMLTMLRLGLNVASTRLILLHGSEGPDAAGNVIRSFGEFTVGGSYAVGIVVFLIFVVINMVVITKGSGRIAEVAARFTLDAMPGKQMAIDADLNNGVLSDEEARHRRQEVQREADFYGAMDGASKFVKGDAIAGIVILIVNLVGGLAIGVFQEGMPLAEAAATYTVLTVGDGLVTQVPALIVSTSAGVVVSRAASGDSLAAELRGQVLGNPPVLQVASGMLGALALVPGFPLLPFAALSGGAYVMSRAAREQMESSEKGEETPPPPPEPSEEERLRGALVLDELELEIGYGLIPLVDASRGGELLGRIRSTRQQLASELGFVVPLVHIRDNLQLEPGGYRILLRGNPVAQGSVPPGRWLAIQPGDDAPAVPGVPGKDPAFGLPARWILEKDKEKAASAGWAVVDGATAVATHLAEVIRAHADELLSRSHLRELLDQFGERSPKVVDDIVPSLVPVALLHRVLRNLLAERVSIRDLGGILETLAEYAPKVQDPDLLTDLVRERLSRTVVGPHVDGKGVLRAVALAPEVEEGLRGAVQRSESGSFLAVDPQTLQGLVEGVRRAAARADGGPDRPGPVLLVSQAVRSPLRNLLGRVVPRLSVMAHTELPPDVSVVTDDVVRLGDAHQAV